MTREADRHRATDPKLILALLKHHARYLALQREQEELAFSRLLHEVSAYLKGLDDLKDGAQ